MNKSVDCNDCEFMLMNEQDQEEMYQITKRKHRPEHICSKHDVRIRHQGQHPKLVPYYECDGKDFKSERR